MSDFNQDEQDEMTELFLQAQANIAEENAVELLNALTALLAHRQCPIDSTEARDAQALLDRIDERAHSYAQAI